MDFSRRTALQVAGTVGLASLAGCSALADLLSGDRHEYTLTVDPVEESPVEHALYDPDQSGLFDAAARDALDAILPDDRHTTYGFEPLPAGAYVEHEGRYLQVASVVTGRERMERTLVRAEPVGGGTSTDDDASTDDARPLDSLPRASARAWRSSTTTTRPADRNRPRICSGTARTRSADPRNWTGPSPATSTARS